MTASAALSGGVARGELTRVAGTRVFFGHQSVGANVLDALPGLYAEHGLTAPPITQDALPQGPEGGFVTHAYIGENEKPLDKIRHFDGKLRAGLTDKLEVAMMKFCYVDVRSDTDVEALFAAYRGALAALERDFAEVSFVKVTVPLTTEASLASRLRARLGRDVRHGQADNVARERFNALVRAQYANDHLFDLAAAESTTPAGLAPTALFAGQRYRVLLDEYSRDGGHLNAAGARRAAVAWLRAVARAAAR